MRPQDRKDPMRDAEGATNREQLDEDQAQDVANDRLYGVPGDDHDMLAGSKPHGGLGIAGDDDFTDTVDQMKQMITSGRIDMGAYDGEPMMDDGDTVVSDAEITDGLTAGLGDDDIGGRVDDIGLLESIADTGDDPLASMSSDHGEEDETADDDAGSDDVGEDDLPGGFVLDEARIDAVRGLDDSEDS